MPSKSPQQLLTAMKQAALAGADNASAVIRAVRDRPEGVALLDAVKNREARDQQATQLVLQVAFASRIELAAMELEVAEEDLRSQVVDALDAANLSHPGDVRDLLALVRRVQTSTGRPTLDEGIAFAEGINCEQVPAFKAELDRLYPVADDE